MAIAGRNAVGLVLLVAGASFSLFPTGTVRAAGFERASPGARANGRAGADVAGGDSPMSFMYNPANIIVGDGTVRLEGALHLHFSERCMQRTEVIETDDGMGNITRSAGATLPNVCSEGGVGAIPELGAAFRVSDKLAFGFGVAVPPAATRSFRLGDPTTGTIDPDGEGGQDPQPTPTRYLLMEQELLQLFLTFTAAYQPHPQFRLGVGFGWGMTKIDYASASFSHIDVLDLGIEQITADADARTALDGFDGFVPRFLIGAWAQPIRDVGLEVGASFQYTQNIETSAATLHLNTISAQVQPQWVADLLGTEGLGAEGSIEGVGLRVPQTSTLAFGIRYAHALAAPVDEVGDRLSNERFDVELDVALNLHGRVDQFQVDPPDDAALTVPDVPVVGDLTVNLPDAITLQKRWRTQVLVRLGGDVSVVPGLLALRAGGSFESHGVTRGYEGLDFQPFRTFGLHTGATVRIAHKIDLSVAYAHIFQPDVTVGVDEAQVRRNVGGDPRPGDDAVVNAGTFTGHSNILIVQAGASF